MNKKEFARRVTDALRENNTRKPVSIKKHTLHISDDDGNSAVFHVKQQDKMVIYTIDDVVNFLDACIAVVADALKNGESVDIRGFGRLCLHRRAARRTKGPNSETWVDVPARHVPKFYFGNDLRMAARLYDVSKETDPRDIPEEEFDEFEEDYE